MFSYVSQYLVPFLLCAAHVRADWAAAYEKAATALKTLSNSEKADLVTGIGWEAGPCVGNLKANPKIGFPALCLQDGPLGIRYAAGVTAFPAGVTTGQTWDTKLMYDRGKALGTESKGVGVHVQLGPVAGSLGKNAKGGRNWEGFSTDPYLSGIAMAQTIQGMQDAGVQACAKHYIGKEQEAGYDTSADMGDRTYQELYSWPFADAVWANVTSVMCSYNKVNGTHACDNSILTTLLKDQLDFKGYVVSDWAAQWTNEQAANAGLDMSMPGDGFGNGKFPWGANLTSAVSNGTVPQSRLDDMATRVLASWYLLGQDSGDYPEVLWSSWANNGTGGPDVQGDHKIVARAVARDGIVLLKNTDNALPLKKPASLAVIGYDAIVNPDGMNACTDRGCDNGTLAMGWGSGTAQFPYLVAPYDAISAQAKLDGTTIQLSGTDDTAAAATAAKGADFAFVFINSDSGEGYITVDGNRGDRNTLDPYHNGDDLVKAVAAVNKKTIVVIHSVGPLILEPYIELENVVAVLWAGLPGQESGNALIDVVYGSTSPSGKLPFTIAKAEEDYGTTIVTADSDNYTEGLYIDYRHFDQAKIEPRFEFGFGLSYTNFTYSSLKTSYTVKTPGASLYDIVATVTATITNSGSVTGAEVAQLYIGLPSSAPATPIQLRGFQKLLLKPQKSETVTFELRRKDLSFWSVEKQAWIVPTGEFDIAVGSSSRDIRLTGKM